MCTGTHLKHSYFRIEPVPSSADRRELGMVRSDSLNCMRLQLDVLPRTQLGDHDVTIDRLRVQRGRLLLPEHSACLCGILAATGKPLEVA